MQVMQSFWNGIQNSSMKQLFHNAESQSNVTENIQFLHHFICTLFSLEN